MKRCPLCAARSGSRVPVHHALCALPPAGRRHKMSGQFIYRRALGIARSLTVKGDQEGTRIEQWPRRSRLAIT